MTIPFVCVLLAYTLIYAPKPVASRAQAKLPGGYDNHNPRDAHAQLTGAGKRAQAAHMNMLEGFAPFAAGVLVCHVAHGSADYAAMLAISYVVLRVAYIAAYLADQATLRSGIWTLGVLATVGLYLLPFVSTT